MLFTVEVQIGGFQARSLLSSLLPVALQQHRLQPTAAAMSPAKFRLLGIWGPGRTAASARLA